MNDAPNAENDQWYETYHSIIFVPPGEIPQTKGPWTSMNLVEEMHAHLRSEHPAETLYYFVDSHCGTISVTTPEDWEFTKQAYAEAYEAEMEYKRLGKCTDCGACSLKEAQSKCRPTTYPSGDTSCAGESLWEEDEEAEEAPAEDDEPEEIPL